MQARICNPARAAPGPGAVLRPGFPGAGGRGGIWNGEELCQRDLQHVADPGDGHHLELAAPGPGHVQGGVVEPAGLGQAGDGDVALCRQLADSGNGVNFVFHMAYLRPWGK